MPSITRLVFRVAFLAACQQLTLADVNPSATRSPVFAPNSVLLEARGGAKVAKKPKAVVSKKKHGEGNHHAEELMSAPTAVANVLADLCPHGMLPIGTYGSIDGSCT